MRRERALKVVLGLVGLLFSAGLYPVTDSLWHANQSMYTDDMMLSLYVALGIFLLIVTSQPDRLHRMVKFQSRRCYGGDGIPEGGGTRSSLGIGCAGCHRCNPDRAGAGEAVSRAGICGRRVVPKSLPTERI